MKKDSTAILFSDDRSEVLIIRRRDVPIWCLPGGGIDEGETAAQAAVREVFEETGIQAEVVRQVGHYTPINSLAAEAWVYECRRVAGIANSQEESLEAQFFPIDALPQPFFFLHQEWLDDALKNLPQPIEAPLTSITWPRFIKYCIMHPILMGRYILSRAGFPFNS